MNLMLEKRNGIAEGEKQKQLEIAKNLKNQNIDIQIIINVTGLTKEEVENL
jgi:MoaA/NifB/PqqE/SkfB family radical SAM enzyme